MDTHVPTYILLLSKSHAGISYVIIIYILLFNCDIRCSFTITDIAFIML